MADCNNLARFMLIICGICYLVSAGALTYIGVWVYSTYEHYDEIAASQLTLVPATIVIGISVVMCVIGILACLAAFKKHKVLLSVLFCLVLLVFMGEVSAGVLGYIYRSKVESNVKDDLKDAIDQYNVTSNKDQIDYIQKELHCCGIHNATDWLHSTYWELGHNNTVPKSCCISNFNDTCTAKIDPKIIYTVGCMDKLESEFNKNLKYIAVAAIVLAVIQLLALLSSCILMCRRKDQGPYQILGNPVGGGLRV